jgi:hypothetical protein
VGGNGFQKTLVRQGEKKRKNPKTRHKLELQRAENNTISSIKRIHKFYPPFSQIRRRKRKEKKIDVGKTEKKNNERNQI